MERDGELDQFQLLEARVDSLIRFIEAFKKENLTNEMELLKEARNKAKQRISSLLDKVEQLDL